MEQIMTISPKLDNIQPVRDSIKNLKSNYHLAKNKSKTTFKYKKFVTLSQQPITVDRSGRKIGSGNEPNFFSVLEYNRENITSRGTMLRMYSDTESTYNTVIPDVK